MGLIAHTYDYNYFNGGGDIGGYSLYSSTTYSSETAEQLAQKFLDQSGILGINLVSKKVLVLGCAYGFLPKCLLALGVNAYGLDISPYALTQVPAEVSGRILLGDARVEADFIRAKTAAGLTKPNDKFDLIIDEDMICCLTDPEAIVCRALALKYSNMFMHLIDLAPNLINWYNYHDIAGWKAVLGTSPKEKWYARFTWSES